MYEDALGENEKLKTRLHDSKQELTKLRSQLEKVTQVRKKFFPIWETGKLMEDNILDKYIEIM